MTDISQLVSGIVQDLTVDEGFRFFAYDDANGKAVVPGYTMKGHITAGYGFALDVAPLTKEESLPILTSRVTAVVNSLLVDMPWISTLSEPRQRALSNMAYNMGVHGEEQFTQFLAFMKAGQFEEAADDLETTLWFKQVGARGQRVVDLIRKG
jgi:lysozyme